jgi:hypothetical protein
MPTDFPSKQEEKKYQTKWLLLLVPELVCLLSYPQVDRPARSPSTYLTTYLTTFLFSSYPHSPANIPIGNSKPRIVQAIESTLAPTKKPTKANTSKPRTTTTTGRVTKPATVKKPRTKTEKVVDTIVGKGEKVVGDVTGKPGKKVCTAV